MEPVHSKGVTRFPSGDIGNPIPTLPLKRREKNRTVLLKLAQMPLAGEVEMQPDYDRVAAR
jgi:hypothetical protein